MRNTLLDPYEHLPRSVVVTANDYPAGSTFPAHTHLRGQLYASRGAISVATPQGRWLVPPQRPAGCRRMAHEMTMNGPVTMLNAFIAPPAAQAARLPDHCCVHGCRPCCACCWIRRSTRQPCTTSRDATAS